MDAARGGREKREALCAAGAGSVFCDGFAWARGRGEVLGLDGIAADCLREGRRTRRLRREGCLMVPCWGFSVSSRLLHSVHDDNKIARRREQVKLSDS